MLPELDKEIIFEFYVPDRLKYLKYTEGSNDRLRFYDYINHDELYKRLSDCYMLLNVGNYGTRQMPSKTVEYVSFRKPLIFFHRGTNDSSLKYLEDYPDICKVDIEHPIEKNRAVLLNYFKEEHSEIKYDDLIKHRQYFESTPEYIRTIIELKH